MIGLGLYKCAILLFFVFVSFSFLPGVPLSWESLYVYRFEYHKILQSNPSLYLPRKYAGIALKLTIHSLIAIPRKSTNIQTMKFCTVALWLLLGAFARAQNDNNVSKSSMFA